MAVALAAMVCLVAGCSDDYGLLEGQRLEVSACGRDGATRVFEPFRLELETFGMDRREGIVTIRMQTGGEVPTEADVFLLQVADEEALREAAGGPVRLDEDDGLVRGALLLNDTCPDSFQPLVAVDGQVAFDELGRSTGDRVRLRLLEFSLRDDRSGEVVGTGFSGEADFTVRGGRPHRNFDD